jgi:ion channel-forming bestrophin family protein
MRPVIRFFRGRTSKDLTATGRKKKRTEVESNVPMEITLFLSSYLAYLLANGLVQPAIATGLVANITGLQDTFNNLERIRNTPLPFAYQAHLRLSLWYVNICRCGC